MIGAGSQLRAASVTEHSRGTITATAVDDRRVSADCIPRVRPPAARRVNASWDSLKILSDPTRLRLLALVTREELSVAELQEILGMGQSRISSQLALLRTVNLVTDRRDGKNAFYSFRESLPSKTLALIKAAVESVSEL